MGALWPLLCYIVHFYGAVTDCLSPFCSFKLEWKLALCFQCCPSTLHFYVAEVLHKMKRFPGFAFCESKGIHACTCQWSLPFLPVRAIFGMHEGGGKDWMPNFSVSTPLQERNLRSGSRCFLSVVLSFRSFWSITGLFHERQVWHRKLSVC